jgi:hypothetical protein
MDQRSRLHASAVELHALGNSRLFRSSTNSRLSHYHPPCHKIAPGSSYASKGFDVVHKYLMQRDLKRGSNYRKMDCGA